MTTRARPTQDLSCAYIKEHAVTSGQTVTLYGAVKATASHDDEVTPIGATTDNPLGIALDAGVGASGARVRVAYLGRGVVPVVIGAAGATRGAGAKYSAAGTLTDATAGGGTTHCAILGQFVESGVSGDIIGLNLGAAAPFAVGS